jgi:hypothetical protein
MMRSTFGLAAAALLAGAAQAQVSITEIHFNPPGTDNTEEAIELQGPANFDLTGWSFLAIEGDGTATGVVDQSISLTGQTLGANGILLLRAAANVVLPGPDAGTNVWVQDFAPDIENGSNTYVLGFGTAPAVGFDVDTPNAGTLDAGALSGFTVVDAVAVLENDGVNNFGYADDLGFPTYGQFNVGGIGPAAHNASALYRVLDLDGQPLSWAGGVTFGTNPNGPYNFDFLANRIAGLLEADFTALDLSLGNENARRSLVGGLGQSAIVALNGGTQSLTLAAGAAQGGKFFLILGSLSGTTPGLPLAPGVTLPLNLDAYTNLLLSSGSLVLSPANGFLNASGRAASTLTLPALPNLVGPITVNHAYLALTIFPVLSIDFASNAVPLVLQ